MTTLPALWTESEEAARFWLRLRSARRSVLMLDYDGTLAPFSNDRLNAYPYPGVEARLATLAHWSHLRVVMVSGRPVSGVERVLAATDGIEIWGNHGWERRKADGSYELSRLSRGELETIERVRQEMERMGFAQAIDAKPASLAIHWRGLEPAAQERIRSTMESLSANQPSPSNLRLLPFDGGVELRSPKRTKGTAVEQILSEEEQGIPAAYLGDDLTDEDAFTAMENRGLSILVRPERRETAARFWIRPPEELLFFLDGWIRSVQSADADARQRGAR